MTVKQQKGLLEFFSQADNSITRKYGGTGLGLAISKQLVQLMNGSIDIQSQLGKGSKFNFTSQFKMKQKKASIDYKDSLLDLQNIRTLIVDNSISAGRILQSILHIYGNHSDIAVSNEEAIEKIKLGFDSKPYELVFIDWKIFSFNCIETIKYLQNHYTQKPLPKFIITSAYSKDIVFKDEPNINIKGFISKPITASSLFDSLLNNNENIKSPHTKINERKSLKQNILTRLNNCKILLVEDNDVNQELAYELLTANGLSVDTANNGQEAINLLNKHKCYDAVLMDINMPVMDGYTASQLIRKEQQWKTLPIIAMTANAMIGDREKSLAAGMNDHITKPIDINTLFKTLNKWVQAIPSSVIKKTSKSSTSNFDNQSDWHNISKLNGINADRAFSICSGNYKLYLRLVEKFTHNYANFKQEFYEKFNKLSKSDKNNPEKSELTRMSHTLKSVAANIGATQLQQLSKQLESICKSGQLDFESTLENVINELNSVIQSLQHLQINNNDTKKNTKLLSKSELHKLILEIYSLLKDDNTAVIKKVKQLELYSKQLAYPEQIIKLSHYTKLYEFENAIEIIKKITDTNKVNVDK